MPDIVDLTREDLPEAGYVFKHSTRCPVSGRAATAVRGSSWDLPVYWVNVVENRALSNWVADHTGVKHESPQLIRIEGGKAVQVWNHGQVNLRAAEKP